MKVFVTGIAGFVGANVARALLNDGHAVIGLIRPDSNLWRLTDVKKSLRLVNGDLNDPPLLLRIVKKTKPDVIIHLGTYGAYHYQANASQIFSTSLLGTHALIVAAKEAGVSMFINAGSSSEYGTKKTPMCESDRIDPNNYYAISKASQTLLCQHEARENGFPIVTLRLFSVYGPFEQQGRLVPTLLYNARNGIDIQLAAPNIARDFIYVTDVAKACIIIAKKNKFAGEILNIGTGKQTTLKDIARSALQITKSSSPITYGNYKARDFDTTMWVANITKMRKMLGMKKLVSLGQGLANMNEWMSKNEKWYVSKT
jgi:nucleoside-diphosphate-sugar epimerase